MAATLALFIALSGTSYAVVRIGSKQIVNNSVRSDDVRNNSLLSSDIRNRTILPKDIAKDSLGGSVISEGELGTVRESRIVDGKSVFDLTVKCPSNTRAAGGACIEEASRPAAGFFTATNQCDQARGSLPSYADYIAGDSPREPAGEWTSDLFQVGSDTQTLIVASEVTSEPIESAQIHPFRCTLPLSN